MANGLGYSPSLRGRSSPALLAPGGAFPLPDRALSPRCCLDIMSEALKPTVYQGKEAHLRSAARLRKLAAEATTEIVKRQLEERAREHERLAGEDPAQD